MHTGHKPYLGAELTLLLSLVAAAGRERGSRRSPAQFGAHLGSEAGRLGRRSPGGEAGAGRSFPRACSGDRAVRASRALRHLWAARTCDAEPGSSGPLARICGERRAPWSATGHAPNLRSFSLVLRVRKEAPGRRQKIPRGSEWRSVFVMVAWPLKD